VNQCRFAQNLCGGLVIILYDRAGDHLRSADPPAKSNKDDQVLVGVRLHRGFHLILRRFQFLLERVPLVVLGKFIDAIAAAEQLLAYSERFSELHDIRADVLHLLTVLGFHGDEPIGYQTAEVEGYLRTIGVGHGNWGAVLSRPVYFSRFAEGSKQLARRRDSDRIAFDGFCHLIRRQTLPFLGRRCGNSSNQGKHGQSNQTNHREDYACLSEIANWNLSRPQPVPPGLLHTGSADTDLPREAKAVLVGAE